MKIGNRLLAMALLGLAGCNQAASPKAAPSAKFASATPAAAAAKTGAYQITLYRGVRTIPGTNNVDWSRASFGVSGNPPILALANNTWNIYAFPCYVKMVVTAPGDAQSLQPGATATLATANPGVGGAGPGPWVVLFDNNPAGHWSIAKTTITGQPNISNNAASTMAGLTFQALVATGGATVINGSNPACIP